MCIRDRRYSLIFLPYLCLLSSKGIFSLKTKKILIVFLLIPLFFNFWTNISFSQNNYEKGEIEFYRNFSKGEIIYSTTPLISYFSDARVIPIYTTLDRAEEFIKKEKPKKIFFSDSFPCNTEECENKKRGLIEWMKKNYNFTSYEEKLYFFVR